ncbi:MAG: molybdopterin molybdenumtransferase MoeA, partial [Betaproteobacteria bacterium]|nr:molybdopterin molybdenumtransferase MoeA [Betaproteobacteria bacterium]
MLSLNDALEELLDAARPVSEVQLLNTLESDGRVLAADQIADINVPPMDNSQMDGYALCSADLDANDRFSVSQRIPAGHLAQSLQAGTVARVFTGAFIPPGADAVVMQEEVELEGDQVIIRHRPGVGQWIRRAGEDIRCGATILERGDRLCPQA